MQYRCGSLRWAYEAAGSEQKAEKHGATVTRDGYLVHLAQAGSIQQTIPLSQSRNNRHKRHHYQRCPKVDCHIGYHLLINLFFF